MPENLFLHIQSRGRSAPRVLELPGDSVRIGRGVECEVRLGEPSLAEVECLLRRRGDSWHVQPLGPPGHLSIDGRNVEHLRALPPGVPLRVGDHWLTLRPNRATAPGFGSFEVPIPVGPSPMFGAGGTAVEGVPLDSRGYDDPTRVAARPSPSERRAAVRSAGSAPSSRAELREKWLQTKHDERVWEARWRAAGQNLRARESPRPATIPIADPAPMPPSPDYPPPVDDPTPISVRFEPRAGRSQSAPLKKAESRREGPPANGKTQARDASISLADFATALAWATPPAGPESVVSATTEIPAFGPEAVSDFLASITGPSPSSAPHVPSPGGVDPSSSRVTPARAPITALRPEVREDESGDVVGPISDTAGIAPALGPTTPIAEPSREVSAEPAPSTALLMAAPPPRRPKTARRPGGGTERPKPPKIAVPLPDDDDLEWPSARVIIAAHQAGSGPKPGPSVRPTNAARKAVSRPLPTEATEPAHWSLPWWLVSVPAFAALLVLGVLGVWLAWTWGQDAREAGLLADRLLRPGATGSEMFEEGEIHDDAAWWGTTGGHLALKAAAHAASKGGPAREESIAFLLDAARKAAPLEPSTRLARARRESDGRDPSSALAWLGLSRDTAALALTGRKLARAGKTEAALAAYRGALELATNAEIGRGQAPTFLDEPNARRFALPYEDLVAGVVRDMASHPDWTFATWSPALPDHGLVLLVTYRVLRDRQSPEAAKALDRLVEAGAAPAGGSAVLHAAARAEGLSLQGRLDEAAALYTEAIEGMPDEPVRRAWWLNLAEILARGVDREKTNDALMAARAGRGDDEIGRRVAQVMAREGLGGKVEPTAAVRSAQRLRAN